MLEITTPAVEGYDDEREEFISIKEQKLVLEHSLVSLSKWESKWCKPFLSKDAKTLEETIDYIKCMTINKDVTDEAYYCLTDKEINKITEYIQAPMTATTFNDAQRKEFDRTIITSELIYYWMVALNIPFECQKWHLNRLLTLIRVCNIKNAPPKKMSGQELYSRNAALNAARKKQFNTHG